MKTHTLDLRRLPETARIFILTVVTLLTSVVLASLLSVSVHALHLAIGEHAPDDLAPLID